KLLRYRDHLARSLQFVQRRLDAKLDLVNDAREILPRLRDLRLALMQHRAFPAAIEQIDAGAHAEGAKLVREKGGVVVGAVAGERLDVGQDLVLGESEA